jgi:hypothetical protein
MPTGVDRSARLLAICNKSFPLEPGCNALEFISRVKARIYDHGDGEPLDPRARVRPSSEHRRRRSARLPSVVDAFNDGDSTAKRLQYFAAIGKEPHLLDRIS